MLRQKPLIRVSNITKRFPRCIALDDVDFEIHGGEVHALFGESGAGKTTLVKILTGLYPPDEGKVYIRGKEVELKSSEHARSLGVSAVYQELSLAPEISIVGSLFLGHEIRRGLFLDNDRMAKEARTYLNKLGFNPHINLEEKVGNLTLADQQIIKIARSLIQDVSVLILDESTQVLHESVKPAMFDIIRKLKSEGKGIIYVSRIMDEITNIADRVTILRDGMNVGALREKEEINEDNLLNSLLGVAFKRRAMSGLPVEYVSSNIESQFGYKPGDFTSSHKVYADIIHDDDVGRVKEELKNFSENRIDCFKQEYRIRCGNGEYKWVRDSVEAIRDHNGVLIYYRSYLIDITKPRQVEEALRKSEEKYKSLIKNVPDTVYSSLPYMSAPMIFISDRYQDWTGYSPDDFYKDPGMWPKSIHHEDMERAMGGYADAIKQKKAFVSEYRVFHKDTGQVHYVVDRSMPVIDEKGNVVRYDGIITDITESKLTQKRLQESEEFLSNVLSHAPNPTVVINPDNSIRLANPAFEKLTGFHVSEVIGLKAPYPWWTNEDGNAPKKNKWRDMFREVRSKEETFRRKDGERFWVERTVVAVGSGDSLRYYLESWNDVTTEKKLRQNLQLYAMEVTKVQEDERKRISRELHDESIQALFSVLTDIEAMRGKGKRLSGGIVEQLQKIQTKVGKTIDEMRRFCHELRPALLDRFGLMPALQLLTKETGEKCELRCHLEVVDAERRLPSEIELVLFRATQEALGNIRKHSKATEVKVVLSFSNSMAEVCVSDNGRGFEAPVSLGNFAREGKLGLAGMQERVRLIGGTLLVKSKLGEGTTVLVRVPALSKKIKQDSRAS
jgi:PAS domain S-box-containing protein